MRISDWSSDVFFSDLADGRWRNGWHGRHGFLSPALIRTKKGRGGDSSALSFVRLHGCYWSLVAASSVTGRAPVSAGSISLSRHVSSAGARVSRPELHIAAAPVLCCGSPVVKM